MKVFALAFLPLLALAQQSSTTSGPCSPVAPNNSGAITINCSGLSAKQGDQMLKILNKILTDRLDTDAVLKKLDEILHAVNPNLPAKTYFCNGQWKTVGPSAVAALSIETGGDDTAFQAMIRLNNAHEYSELLGLCQAQILSPKLFCAVAHLMTGKKIRLQQS